METALTLTEANQIFLSQFLEYRITSPGGTVCCTDYNYKIFLQENTQRFFCFLFVLFSLKQSYVFVLFVSVFQKNL